MTNLKQTIMTKIESGTVLMKPRWHFVLQGMLYITGAMLVALIAVYGVSFVLFALRETGVWFAPGMGLGVMFFIVSSPWLLITVTMLFIIALYFLITKFDFSYRIPHVYILILMVMLVLVFSTALHILSIHDRIRQVPGFESIYTAGLPSRPRDITPGHIIAIGDGSFIIESKKEGVITIMVTEQTRLPNSSLGIGDQVVIFGPRTTSTITAFGVKRIDDYMPKIFRDDSADNPNRPTPPPPKQK